jgi:putative ABC transport system permease protein
MSQIVGMAFLEGLFMSAIALGLGLLGGVGLAQLMGKVRSFLDFSAPTGLRVLVTSTAVRAALIATGLSLLAYVLPSAVAARYSIVAYKQEASRNLSTPWWQKMGLDFILFALAAYSLYNLRQQGQLLGLGTGDTSFQNPALLLLPAFSAFALTLVTLRFIPIIMSIFSWLLTKMRGFSLLIAIKHLARSPRFYTTPIILLVLTVTLAIFAASLAFTLDLQLFDRMYYQIGADIRLFDVGQTPVDTTDAEAPRFFLPISSYEDVPGVDAAARVGRYKAIANLVGGRVNGIFLGIDRTDFQHVAYWRRDFADTQLGSLLNILAQSPDGVLVSQDFLQREGMRIGDTMRLVVLLGSEQIDLSMQVVGAFDYFPTWYPGEDEPLFVGELGQIFNRIGSEYSYQVWLQTNADFEPIQFEDGLIERQLTTWQSTNPRQMVEAEQARPERQGLFGLLSVGFLAAILLTVIGFLLYALFSFRRRSVELGALQAIGMSIRQVIVYATAELAGLILMGLVLGVVLGILISQEYVPYLQFGAAATERIPPFLVEIAWGAIMQITAVFSLLFLTAFTALAFFLARMKVFQVLKLGETT